MCLKHNIYVFHHCSFPIVVIFPNFVSQHLKKHVRKKNGLPSAYHDLFDRHLRDQLQQHRHVADHDVLVADVQQQQLLVEDVEQHQQQHQKQHSHWAPKLV